MSRSYDNSTDELNNLLNPNRKPKPELTTSSSSSSDDHGCHHNHNNNHNNNTNDNSINQYFAIALTDLKNDYGKLIKIVSVLGKEVKHIKKRLDEIEHNSSSTECKSSKSSSSDDSSDTNKKDCSSSDSYQEHIDKILSIKLDELSQKVDNKINELCRAVSQTRTLALRRR
jgi:tetrahydromethanopterin S-methyltransferase subunit G